MRSLLGELRSGCPGHIEVSANQGTFPGSAAIGQRVYAYWRPHLGPFSARQEVT
ncbi:MAG TPA: hypothetical protein VFA40_12200 [Terriglobales bacterium]|nr:hypothetical protein [Terriglobales bacterium]